MSKLNDLIEELCTDGVEFVKLGDVCDIKRGVRVIKKNLQAIGCNPVFQNSLIPLGYKDEANYPANTTFVISAGAAGDIGYSSIPFWAADDCLAISCPSCIINKFIYYFLKSNERSIKSKVRKASVPRLSRTVIENILFPLPPLPIQEEIVRILDSFAELEAELEAELDCRKRQYEFYRDRLLSFEDDDTEKSKVVWKKMSEVCKIMNGKDYKQLSEGAIPVYGSGGIMTYVNEYAYDKPSVLIPRKGSIGNLFYVEKPFWTVDTIYWTNIDASLIIPKFFYYFLTTKDLTKLNTAAGVPSLTQSMLYKIKIPLPPLSVQQRIVSILDRFEALTTDLQNGLPAEIEARRQQYEYYRDKLLTFKEKER